MMSNRHPDLFTTNKNNNSNRTNTNKDKMMTTTEGSFIKHYGILAVPMIFMICFGCFRFRSGQLTRGIWACLINFFFFFLFTLLITTLCIFLITTKSFHNIFVIYLYFVFLCYLIHYILLIYKFYKKYNLYCLFQDIKNARLNRLSKLETLKVFFLLFLCFLLLIYILYYNSTAIFHVNNDKLWTRTLMILYQFLSPILVYMSIVCLSFMTCVFTIVLSGEFDQCNRDLKDKLTTDKYLTHDTFMRATKRFNELANMVDKLNEMTRDLVAVALVVALGSLCFTIYSTILDSNNIIGNMVNVCEAILIVCLLLPPGMLLNKKVKLLKLLIVP